MKINSLQSTYVQKSRMFLYPLLGIRRGVSVTPIQTYMSWKNVYDIIDNKLIVVYHLRDDEDFKKFEEKVLLGNKLFDNFFELEDGTGAYVFDLSSYKRELKCIINGKYSKLPDEYKRRVLSFFRNHHRHHASISSYLNPHMYYDDYAELLNISKDILLEVGELCSLPDLNSETLSVKEKVLNFESVNNL